MHCSYTSSTQEYSIAEFISLICIGLALSALICCTAFLRKNKAQ